MTPLGVNWSDTSISRDTTGKVLNKQKLLTNVMGTCCVYLGAVEDNILSVLEQPGHTADISIHIPCVLFIHQMFKHILFDFGKCKLLVLG